MKNNFGHLIEYAEPDEFSRWEKVDLEICAFTDLGFKVAINDEYTGLVYANQVYEHYQEGQKLKGYIAGIRDDGRIDVEVGSFAKTQFWLRSLRHSAPWLLLRNEKMIMMLLQGKH